MLFVQQPKTCVHRSLAMEEKKQRPHLLAVPFPALGNINPMLQLCKTLVSNGFFITFLISNKRETFLATEQQATGQHLRFVYLPDAFIPEAFSVTTVPLQFVAILEKNLKLAVPEIIRDIMTDDSLPRVSCILTDLAITSLQDVAHQFGICKVSLSTFSASWLSIENGLLVLEENGLLPLKDFVPGLPPISGLDFPSHLQEVHAVDPDFSLRYTRNQIIRSDALVFINSFYELETSQLDQLARDTPQFVPIGPLLPSFAFDGQVGVDEHEQERCGFWTEDMSCLDWLDQQPFKSVIYVSFGSLASASPDQIKQLYTGLVQSDYPFLWVIRPDNDELRKLFDDPSYDKCKFVSWAPQLKVLKHRSVGAFLTHCGWNSVLETIVAGVPVLGWPFLFDQPLNCALAVEHWKIGSRLPPGPDATLVEKAVKDMMGEAGQMWRDNVTKLAISARDAVSDGGLSHRNLEAFKCKMEIVS
ncbi:UDP-glycosyltransferase 74D1 isoform X3 [Selaginella moellendorffii]|uniref:UDP-glycosyltransferase 74D1 isoform X3 n=1 Tax=Selaginella moellendorffii TaxID=88036 RepID=UPI000D1CD1B5|nr:UDP-glycosyltransferase 74D1 isoform X3 [Selaginella moellendorffii]|eukprot:XP_024517919.1 UDP-glycosyltransferase 74D1 isoform X3 [Selaginella moellendorffii]